MVDKKFENYKITKLIKTADFFTLGNALFGLIAIIALLKNEFAISAVCMLLSVVFDYLDGKVARIMKNESEFGKELDSLSDVISFGVAPAIFGFSIMQLNLELSFGFVAIVFFMFCGMLRLARFNIMKIKGFFAGMPITTNGIIIPAVYFLNLRNDLYPFLFLILGILMISNFRLKKVF